jgi:uncharacterized repeat protein (TIGR01451 family)
MLSACGGGSGRQGTDIVVTGSGPTNQLAAGDSAVFTMTVANNGDNDASDVTISDHTSGLSLSGITCSASGGATCPASTSGTMSIPSLPAGGSLTFQVSTSVAQVGNGLVTVQNTMTAQYGTDVDSSNNSATVDAAAYIASADVSVTGTNPTQAVAAGSTAEFVFTVGNSGADAASNVTLTATANAGSMTISCTAGNGATCPSDLASHMTVDQLPANGTLTFTVDVAVSATFNGLVQAELRASSSATSTAAATYDPDTSNNSLTLQVEATTSTDLTVTQTVPSTVSAGDTAQFNVVVTNPGSSTLSNVALTDSLTSGFTATVSCVPGSSSGIACPNVSNPASITIPTMRGGDYLTLLYSVTVPSTWRGAITNTVQVSAAGDPNTANNTAVATTQAVDGLSGTYTVFAANGLQYSLTIDFDQNTYTMSGNGQTWTKTFAAAGNGDFVVTGSTLERMRTATDLIVGGQDFGTGEGVLPYVAARSFVTSLLQAQGTYDLATRDVSGSSATTHAGTASISNNTLAICQTDNDVQRPSSCGGSLVSYALTVSGNTFTAVNTQVPSDSYNFMIARSGALTLLISAGALTDGSGNQQLRIGLPDSSGIAGASSLSGPSTLGTTGDWVTISNLSQTTYGFTSLLNNSDTATLVQISAGGPFAMRDGTLQSSGAPIYVLQAVPLEVTVGDFSGAASGLLQITLP